MSLINTSAFDAESNSFMGLPFGRELGNSHRSLIGNPTLYTTKAV